MWSKRLLDGVLAALGLVVLSPLMLVVELAVRSHLGVPVLFRQERAGKNGRPFHIVKFRTMTEGRDARGQLLRDAERLTPLGRFLRSSSLDELPELWNVLKGEMSLVGPRPLPVRYLPRYSPAQARRHTVTPGITGWAQINGRNAQTWEERFELDLWYVDNRSLMLDLRILALTARAVFAGRGAGTAGEVDTPEFQGSARAEGA